MTCNHTEAGKTRSGVRVDLHSCRYVERVNALIPIAEAAADDRLAQYELDHGRFAKTLDGKIRRDDLWSVYFHEEMRDACEAEGLRRSVPRRVLS